VRVIECRKPSYIKARERFVTLVINLSSRGRLTNVYFNFDTSKLIGICTAFLIMAFIFDLVLFSLRNPLAGGFSFVMITETIWILWFATKKMENFLKAFVSYITEVENNDRAID